VEFLDAPRDGDIVKEAYEVYNPMLTGDFADEWKAWTDKYSPPSLFSLCSLSSSPLLLVFIFMLTNAFTRATADPQYFAKEDWKAGEKVDLRKYDNSLLFPFALLIYL